MKWWSAIVDFFSVLFGIKKATTLPELLDEPKKEPVKEDPKKEDPPKPVPVEDPIPWHTLQVSLLGMKELLPDGKVNPIVTEMFSYTTYPTKANEAWCAADQCYVLAKTGYKNPRTALATGFNKYGVACELKKGAIVVIQHLTGSMKGRYHVTQFSHWVDEANGIAACIGGNQNNSVCYVNYDLKTKEKVVACRWPVKEDAPKPKAASLAVKSTKSASKKVAKKKKKKSA